MTNWTKLYEEGVDIDEEFDTFEPMIPTGSCQPSDDDVYFEETQEKDIKE